MRQPPAPRMSAPDAAPGMSALTVVVLLSLLLGIQPMTTDLYLPALPALTRDLGAGLGAGLGQAQLTLTALLLAFGTSQLVWGPVSDRWGRRPVLLAGLALYTLAAVGGALAASMSALIVWRTLQGAAMGAAVMSARAIVRDLYAPLDGAHVMSKGLSGLGLLAVAAPLLGSVLAHWGGWRLALAALAVSGALTLAALAWRFVETVPPERRQRLDPAALLQTWASIVRHPGFLSWSLLSAASYAGLFTFLGSSSFAFISELGLTQVQYGWLMASNAVAYFIGTFICRRWLARVGVQRTVARAGVLTLTGSLGVLVLTYLSIVFGSQSWFGWWVIMAPFYLFMLGHGIHQPCGQSGAVAPFAHAAGTASALNGFVMMATAFGVGLWLGQRTGASVLALAHGVAFWGTLIAAIAWTLVPRFGDPARG